VTYRKIANRIIDPKQTNLGAVGAALLKAAKAR
jgi:hypothetical protein